MEADLPEIGHLGEPSQSTANILPILVSDERANLPKWKVKLFSGGKYCNAVDEDINSAAKEISGPWISSVCITCPANPHETLDITLPFINLVVKNIGKGFAFEVHVLDDKGLVRETCVATNRSMVQWSLTQCQIPLKLDLCWNKIAFDLVHYTKLLFGSRYVKTLRVKVYANCYLKHIYFSDRIYTNLEHPDGFKVHLHVCKANTSVYSKLKRKKKINPIKSSY